MTTETIDLTQIAAAMESIGRNCEFGIVQRKIGAEPISLLRWAGTATDNLIRAFENEFEGLAEEMEGRAEPPTASPEQQHWWLTCKRYGLTFHTEHFVGRLSAEEAAIKVRPRLLWQAKKLLTDIRSCERLFTYSSADFRSPSDAVPFINAFRRIGRTAPLLVVWAGSSEPPRQFDEFTWMAALPKLTSWGGAGQADISGWLGLIAGMAPIVAAIADAKLPA